MLGKTVIFFWILEIFFFSILHLSSQPKDSLHVRGFVAEIQVKYTVNI